MHQTHVHTVARNAEQAGDTKGETDFNSHRATTGESCDSILAEERMKKRKIQSGKTNANGRHPTTSSPGAKSFSQEPVRQNCTISASIRHHTKQTWVATLPAR